MTAAVWIPPLAAAALGMRPRLIPVPVAELRAAAAAAAGRRDVAQRLCDSRQVDLGPTRDARDWSPPVGVDAALADTARALRARVAA